MTLKLFNERNKSSGVLSKCKVMKVWETETVYLHGSLCIGYDQTEKINWDLDVVVRLRIRVIRLEVE